MSVLSAAEFSVTLDRAGVILAPNGKAILVDTVWLQLGDISRLIKDLQNIVDTLWDRATPEGLREADNLPGGGLTCARENCNHPRYRHAGRVRCRDCSCELFVARPRTFESIARVRAAYAEIENAKRGITYD